MTRAQSGTGNLILVGIATAVIVAVIALENLGANALNNLLLYLPGVDKVLHGFQSFIVFRVFHYVARRTSIPSTRGVVLAALATLSLAAFDEIQQTFNRERTIESADLAAGVGGLIMGIASVSASRFPRAAAAVGLAGAVLTGVVTYASYLTTKDYNRGILLDRQGNLREARLAYLDALRSGRRHADWYNAAAWATLQLADGDPAEAVALAEQALALRPGDGDTLDTYGWALHRAGRTNEAVQALERALAAKPDIYCIHYHLAVVYLALGRRADGIRHLRQQIESMPRAKEARLSADLLATLDRSEPPR